MRIRDNLPNEIDGLVYKVNDFALQEFRPAEQQTIIANSKKFINSFISKLKASFLKRMIILRNRSELI